MLSSRSSILELFIVLRMTHACVQGSAGMPSIFSQNGLVLWQDPELYDKLPEPTDDENDMLDLAYGLTETYAAP